MQKGIRNYIKQPLFILFVAFVLCACGARRDLYKAQRLIDRAISKGAEVKSDTVFKHARFKIPGVAFNTTLLAPDWLDTVYIKGKDSIHVKIKRIPAKDKEPEKVYVEVDCPDKVIDKEIPVAIDQEIKTGYSLWDMIILAIVCLAVGYFLVGPVVALVRKFFPG